MKGFRQSPLSKIGIIQTKSFLEHICQDPAWWQTLEVTASDITPSTAEVTISNPRAKHTFLFTDATEGRDLSLQVEIFYEKQRFQE